MATLSFSDGVTIDTSGPLRTMKLADGWYVVGEGYLIPCADQQDAENELKIIKLEKEMVSHDQT